MSVVRPGGTGASARDIIVTVAQTRLKLEQVSRTITTTAMDVGAGFFLVATGALRRSKTSVTLIVMLCTAL